MLSKKIPNFITPLSVYTLKTMFVKGNIFYRQVRFAYFRVLFLFLLASSSITALAQNDAVLVIKGQTSALSRAKGLGLNSGVKTVNFKEEPIEGVTIELKKNGATVQKLSSGKKGRYSFEIPVSTTDLKNDYVIYFSMEGMAPRMVFVNAFLTKDEFKKYQSAKYEIELNEGLYGTTVTDIELDKPNAKIKWDAVKEHKFSFDEAQARFMAGEEAKMKANADAYFTALAKKKKKTDDVLAKKKAAEDAKLKAAEDAKKKELEEAQRLAAEKAKAEADRLAAIKAKEDADRAQREKDEMARKESLRRHKADSLAELARLKELEMANAKIDIKSNVRQAVQEVFESKDRYDVSEAYSISIARRAISAEKQRRNMVKGKNLSAKYETFNILTSLLDEVDESDRKGRKQ